MEKVKTLNLDDKKVIERLNKTIIENYLKVISSEQLKTLLNKIAAENGTITVQVRGGFITSQLAIYEHEEFEVFISNKENEETEMIEETFTIYDTTGEKGNFYWDNLEVSEIYWDAWSNVFRVYFNEGYEVVEIEYFDIDITPEEFQQEIQI